MVILSRLNFNLLLLYDKITFFEKNHRQRAFKLFGDDT